MLPELFLNFFLDVVYLVTLVGVLFATDEAWGRMRHLDPLKFDKQGRPTTAEVRPVGSALHGTHAIRRNLRSAMTAVAICLFALDCSVFAVSLPLTNLPAAWMVIAVYVLAGSLATVGRLVPVRTF